jgi:8-oxo-dGTP pyrophosphatase MutT (NUDIX family)
MPQQVRVRCIPSPWQAEAVRAGPDSRGDGDGWVRCEAGHRHWGLFGAAGLLLSRPGDDTVEVLLQHRAEWSHHGGTWGLPGGARHRGETATAAALREASEEGGLDPADVRVHGRYDDGHGGWSYVTVLGTAAVGTSARPTGGESIDVAWVPVAGVGELPLHPGFGMSWPRLRSELAPVTLVPTRRCSRSRIRSIATAMA